MKLVIVESPSKTKTIGKYLGNEYKVVSSKGHVRDLSTSGKFGLGVDVENDFKPNYIPIAGKKKVINETNQVLGNQQLVIGNAKNSVISAVNIGCQNKEEFINMTTQITEHNSSKDEIHKNAIENQVSAFQQSKGTLNVPTNEKNPTLVKKQNSTNHNQNSGFVSTISLIMITTFIVGLVVGITYMICIFMIGG